MAELSLVLEEMAGMGEDERQAAHEHHGHAVRLLESIGEELGPLGPDPAREQERIARMVRESMTTNGGRP